MKKFKIELVVTSSDEFFEENALKMKLEIDSGEFKNEMFTEKDRKEGMIDLEVTFEELPL
jgi:hypothetical protein